VCPESPSGLRWTVRRPGRPRHGHAGCHNVDGYWRVRYAGALYPVHRVIWTHLHGEIPAGHVVDHRDGDKGNNNPENLQCISQSENAARRPCAGYDWRKDSQKWRARVGTAGGKQRHLGYFDTEEEAAAAALEARRRLLGDVL
jgi:hypothetical protein